MGFQVLTSTKGSFVDGHEHAHVVKYRNKFLRQMVGLGFLNSENTPTDAAKQALPTDLQCRLPSLIEKTVIFFHDESTCTFQCNDDQPTFWGTKGTHDIRPKPKGSGIMVSDFISEHGYLALTMEEYDRVKNSDPSIRLQAREFLEYG